MVEVVIFSRAGKSISGRVTGEDGDIIHKDFKMVKRGREKNI